MKRYRNQITTFLVCVCLFSVFLIHKNTQAQYDITEDDITILTDPEIPGPNENIVIKLTSYVTDINSAFIIWKVNDKVTLSGTGAKKFQITSGGLGELTTISIVIRPVSGEILEKQLIIRPADLDILWEGADSYTPPFYRGRALPTSEGLIRVLAIPQIKEGNSIINTNDFVFKWKKNDKVIQDSSGYGKNYTTFRQSYLNSEESLDVNAKSVKSSFLAQKTVAIPVFKPKIIFYEKDPLLGINYTNALKDNISVSNGEKTIVAEPYFFGPFSALSPELSYLWKINGESVETPKVKNVITIKKGDKPGLATLTLEVKNILRLFMNTTNKLTINLK